MAAPDYTLRIRLEFEDSVKRLTGKISDITSGFSTASKHASDFAKEAKKGGEAAIATMTSFREALKEFDLSKPILSTMNLIRSAFSTISERIGFFGKIAFGAASGLFVLFTRIARFQDELVNTFAQLSSWFKTADGTIARLSMGERVEKALRQITSAAFRTSTSLNEVVSIYTQLALIRVPFEDLEKLSENAIIASRALGVSSDRAGQFIGNLRVIGGIGVKNIEDVISAFASVQDVVGLTNAELTDVMDTVESLTLQIKGLGATSRDIANVAKETARLAGLFGELGLKAQRGTDIIKTLMDPTRTRENLFLMQKMGFTFQEMQRMQAGQLGEREITSGLVRAAKRFREMTANMMPVQAARIAQLYGMSMQELNRLAEKGDEILAKMDSAQAKSDEILRQRAAEGMSQFNKAFERFSAVIQAMFSGPAVKVIGFLTEKLEKLNLWWLNNSEAIEKSTKKLFDDIIDWISKIDLNFIIDGFKGLFNALSMVGKAVKFVIDNFSILITVIGGLFILKTIIGLFGGLSGVLSAIIPKIGIFSKTTSLLTTSTASMSMSLSAGVAAFIKFAGIGALIVGLAFSIKLVVDAIKNLVNVDWGSIAKGGVVLAGFAAAAGGIIAAVTAFSTALAPAMPVIVGVTLVIMGLAKAVEFLTTGFKNIGDSIKSGVEGLKELSSNSINIGANVLNLKSGISDFIDLLEPLSKRLSEVSPTLTETSKGFKNISEGISALDPKKLLELSNSVNDKTVATFEKIGYAIATLNKAAGDINLGFLDAQTKTLESLGKGVKDLAISVYVLDKTANSTTAMANVSLIIKNIMSSFKEMPLIIGDVEKVGLAFKEITSSLNEFTKIDPKKFNDINSGMLATSKGLESWFKSFNSLKKVSENFNLVGESFKQLSIGIWVLGKTDFNNIGNNIEKLVDPVTDLLKAISENQVKNANIGEAFFKVIDAIKKFSELKRENIESVSIAINIMGESVSSWIESIGKSSGTFFKDVIKTATAFDMTTKSISAMGNASNIERMASSIKTMGDSISSWLQSIGNASRFNFGNVINTARAFSIVTKSISEMFSASGDKSPISVATSINLIKESITSWIEALSKNATYIANIEGVGKSFKSLSEGISLILSSKIENLGPASEKLKSFVPTLSDVFSKMKEFSDIQIFGLTFGKSMGSVGSSFKELSESFSSLESLASLKKEDLVSTFASISSGLTTFFTEVKKLPVIDVEIEQINKLVGSLDYIRKTGSYALTTINMLSVGISNIATSLKDFKAAISGSGNITNDFIKFIEKISSAKISTESKVTSTIDYGESFDLISKSIDANTNLQVYIQNATKIIVEAIDKLNSEENRRHSESLNVLIGINDETRRSRKTISSKL